MAARLTISAALALAAPCAHAGAFADLVIGYTPAPGQFINAPSPFTGQSFNDPASALGAPIGGGTAAPNNDKLVTLGGFGGSIVLGFSETVLDDPCNPYGLDAIVFGNAFWLGGPQNASTEPGVIEIALDANDNGLADDPWYVIPGSAIASPPDAQLASQPWDNDPNTATPPAVTSFYPDDAIYDHVPPGFPSGYSTTTFGLPVGLLSDAAAFGYADRSPVLILGDLDGDDVVDDPQADPASFYTTPDNPFAPGIDPGSGGGDAFDIAWAVDPATGEPAGLIGFDFVRISTGVNSEQGPLGEISTEIGAVADVTPDELFFDIDGSSATDVEDLYRWHEAPVDLSGEGVADGTDRALLQACVRRGETSDVEAPR